MTKPPFALCSMHYRICCISYHLQYNAEKVKDNARQGVVQLLENIGGGAKNIA